MHQTFSATRKFSLCAYIVGLNFARSWDFSPTSTHCLLFAYVSVSVNPSLSLSPCFLFVSFCLCPSLVSPILYSLSVSLHVSVCLSSSFIILSTIYPVAYSPVPNSFSSSTEAKLAHSLIPTAPLAYFCIYRN